MVARTPEVTVLQFAPDRRSLAYARKVLLVLLVLLALISVAQGSRNAVNASGSIDLGMSLKAAQALQRENPYSRHLRQQDTFAREQTSNVNPFPMMPMQVPSVLMLLWPVAGLSWPAAKLAWLFANLAFTGGVLALTLKRFLPRRPAWCYLAIAALLLMSFPWRVIVGNGQHLVAALFFFMLSLELADRGYRKWAGVALAISFLKYTVTLFLLPYFVWKRQWAPLVTAFAIHAAMTVGIALWLKENPVVLLDQARRAGSGILATAGYIDLFAVSSSLGLPLLAAVMAAMAGTALTYWLALRRRGDEASFLALLCFWSIAAIYHRAYDAVILLIPLLVALRVTDRGWLVSSLIFAVLACTWALDRVVLEFTSWLDQGPGGRQSAYFFLTASLFYATLAALFFQQMRPHSYPRPRDNRAVGDFNTESPTPVA